ncbi:primosomal protein N' [Candidatus Peregrinibacteria bacterium]|nr:MAG: primosomal protein N' [Candidatus Peregrinibacteria bacterium]
MTYARVAIRRHICGREDGTFLFSLPKEMDFARPGMIVSVPFRKKTERGIIVALQEEEPHFVTEPIREITGESLLSENHFAFAQKVSEMSMCPLAKVIPLFLPETIFRGSGNSPTKTFFKGTSEETPRGTKMKLIWEFLRNAKQEISAEAIKKETSATPDVLRRLQEGGFVEALQKPFFPPDWKAESFLPKISSEEAPKTLLPIFPDSKILLDGPTSSGKSHLLRHSARTVLESGKSVLFLVPEIGLTSELLQKCQETFGHERVVAYHSRLSDGQRAQIFWGVRAGYYRVVVGSRSSLFLPFQNLGLVALEEEHEWSLKSDQAPRYHARNAAEALADIFQAPLVLSSATPSLETLFRVKSGFLQQFSLPPRIPLPHIRIVDIREEAKSGNRNTLSRALIFECQKMLANGKQVLIFLNRRGLFRILKCQECGDAVRNPENGIALVAHGNSGNAPHLMCHQTGKIFQTPSRCPSCGSTQLSFFGNGTEGVEQESKRLFPGKKVIRIDRDSASRKNAFKTLHQEFESGKADILVGTEIVAKGLDFSNVGLVGILDADAGLHFPDFRSEERTFQLLLQVIGRAGRRGESSSVILQTRLPHHPLFQEVLRGDFESFSSRELAERKKHFLPPFTKIIKLIFVGKNRKGVFQSARETELLLRDALRRKFPEEHVEIFVAPSLHHRRQGNFFVHLLLIAKDPQKILLSIPLPLGIRIDPNPIDVVA